MRALNASNDASEPLYWLTYRHAGNFAGVAIVPADALILARMNAAVAGLDGGLELAEGHPLDDKYRRVVATAERDRLLSAREADKLLKRFEVA